ncbi:MAG: hypothetical protein CVV28_07775 [Methanobacteriales archaeon HGW-Methanobacteriales-1]|jgi:hypothetical protein|nr:MAG: hypothetical protein CVV28_07775 [Methanobacteriales archaeon HGW-Methanobacteriales-1]
MYKYKAFGLNIHSEIFLPELVQYESKKPDLTIKYGHFDIYSGNTIVEGEYFRVTKKTIYRFWDEIGKFKISNGNEIIVNSVPDINDLILRSFILGTVMATLLYQRGLFLLHASAVNINNQAIAFLGIKGYGKSTTAMTFYKEGYPIIADDYIAIDMKNQTPLIKPGFPSLRLSYKSRQYGNFSLQKVYYNDYEIDKIHVPTVNSFSLKEIPLKKLYVLQRGNKISIDNFKPQEAIIKLVENTFGISRYKKSDHPIHLQQCASLLKYVDISLLEIPDSLEELYKVIKSIQKDMG